MLGLISFIVVIIGAINWFCIGLLQFDFVAGLFGSQSSIFSRIVYIAVGLGALILLFNLIENKGKIKFNFKKKQIKNEEVKQHTYYSQPKYANQIESGKDFHHTNNDSKIEPLNTDNSKNACNNGSCQITHEAKNDDNNLNTEANHYDNKY